MSLNDAKRHLYETRKPKPQFRPFFLPQGIFGVVACSLARWHNPTSSVSCRGAQGDVQQPETTTFQDERKNQLQELEGIVDRGREVFIQVDEALDELRSRKLYEPDYPGLYDAGCSDTLVASVDGSEAGRADFDREAPSMEAAVASAIADVGKVEGVAVEGVAVEETSTGRGE